jgi:hypothetical protein
MLKVEWRDAPKKVSPLFARRYHIVVQCSEVERSKGKDCVRTSPVQHDQKMQHFEIFSAATAIMYNGNPARPEPINEGTPGCGSKHAFSGMPCVRTIVICDPLWHFTPGSTVLYSTEGKEAER